MPPPKRGKYLSISVKTNPVHNLGQAAGDSHKPYGIPHFPYNNYIAKFQFAYYRIDAVRTK